MDRCKDHRHRDGQRRVPLVDGGVERPGQDVRQARLARRLPDPRLQGLPRHEVARAQWHQAGGRPNRWLHAAVLGGQGGSPKLN